MLTLQNHETQKKRRTELDMLHGSLWDKILIFAIPLACTGILQQLFNAADVAVIGRYVGSEAMAAVGSNSAIIGLAINLFVGVSLGANVVIATFIGQRRWEDIHRAVHTALLVAVLSGILVAIIGELVAGPLLRLLGVPDEVMGMAVLYLRVYMAGMPVILLYNFESAIFRSQGDTKTPLICLTISGVLNVGLNLFFVIVCGMTVEGVALATVISNGISAALLFRILLRSESVVRVRFSELRIDPHLLGSMLRIGLPAGLQGCVFSLSNILIQSAINRLGADIMAGSAAAFNVEILAFFLINSFGQATTTFVGQNHGAMQQQRCVRATRIALAMGICAALLFCACVLPLATQLLSIFNPTPVIVSAGVIRLHFILIPEGVNAVMEVMSGNMRGYGLSLIPALITLAGVCGVRITWVFSVFRMHPTFQTLLSAYPISWILTATSLVIAYFIVQHRLIKE